MNLDGARRVMETPSVDTANQYLRFGWKLINQHVVEPHDGLPAGMNYVLASIRTIEDTKEIITLTDERLVNTYLSLGWKLIDKYRTAAADDHRRHETLHLVLAWQREEEPVHPGNAETERPAESPSPTDSEIGLEKNKARKTKKK